VKGKERHATGYIVLSAFFIEAFRKKMITVLIADDHSFVRKALKWLLEMEGDIQIVAMASDGQEAVEQAVLHRPNVAVMDVSMPLMDGIEATKQICVCCPRTRVLMHSMNATADNVHHGIQAGASGYVLKDATSSDLVIAVRTVFQGNPYFSKQIAETARHYIE
jgi:DNA-binding NarL/FixJ family response regulator